MSHPEPTATALLLATLGALLVVSIVSSRASERVGVPVAIVFLLVGMAAGSEGLGGIPFEDYRFAFRIGATALVLILFDGGLNTPFSAVRQGFRPAAVLATVGVVGTAALMALGARLLGFPWSTAMLIGAVVSPTDAAAVFSVLRGSGLHLRRRVGVTLEIESGLNDPLAVILTTALTRNLMSAGAAFDGWRVALETMMQVILGAALGIAIGLGGRQLLVRYRLPAGGLYPVFTVALAFLAFGATTLAGGSGFLAVYVAAVILGNGPLPFRAGLLRVHDTVAWLAQIAMFLILGLLVFPSHLLDVAAVGLVLALLLAFIARPAVATVCLLPFGFSAREAAYIGWVGLRGAVPIILATIPVLAAAPGAERIFDLVFFVVVATALVPGGTVAWVTRRLGLAAPVPPPPRAVLEIESRQPLRGELLSFYVEPALAVANVPLADLPFPDGAAVTMIVREQELVPPKGGTALLPGDHVYVLVRPEDRAFIQLMFGRPEEG